MRKPINIGRAIYKETESNLTLYISCFIYFRSIWIKKILYFYDELICNIDETPLIFNLVPNKVVAMKGAKSVIVKTIGQEKVYCTILLGKLSNRNILSPKIVFKGNKEGKLSES